MTRSGSQSPVRAPGLINLAHRRDVIRNTVGHDATSIGEPPSETRRDPGLTEFEHLRMVEAEEFMVRADRERQAMARQIRELRDQLLTDRAMITNQVVDGGPVLPEYSSARPHVTSADAQERVV